MAWFRYIKYNSEIPSSDYVYPILKREIIFPKPKNIIPEGTWLFVDIKGLNINKYINSSLQETELDETYVVVYEDIAQDGTSFDIVSSQIVDDYLFFTTKEEHLENVALTKKYSIYYKTKDIRNIQKINNNGVLEYLQVDAEESEYEAAPSTIPDFTLTAGQSDSNQYSISFINQNVDWKDTVSFRPGAKAVGYFTGPALYLNLDKGPDYGYAKLSIIELSDEATPTSLKVVDGQIIDLYSVDKTTENVYSNESLDYRNYIFEIESTFEKNPLSSNGKIKVNSFSYLYNAYLKLDKEEISPFLLGRVIVGVK